VPADDVARGEQGRAQVFHRLRCGVADAGDEFDGVAQQLLVHPRVFADFGDHRGGFVGEIPGFGVDERELPLDPDRGPGRCGEVDPAFGQRLASR